MGRAYLAAYGRFGVIIDFRNLEYSWGDQLDLVFGIGDGQYGSEPFPMALVVGPNCEDAVRTLLHDNWDDERPVDIYPWVHRDLVSATAKLIALRKYLPHFKYTRHLLHDQPGRRGDFHWIYPTGHPHRDNPNAIGMLLRAPRGRNGVRRREPVVLLYNGSSEQSAFNLPSGKWKVLADGQSLAVARAGVDGRTAEGDYRLHPGTFVLLQRQ